MIQQVNLISNALLFFISVTCSVKVLFGEWNVNSEFILNV